MIILAVFAVVFAIGGTVSATSSSHSAHYKITETQIGAGSVLNDCSASYCSKISVGDLVVGSGKSDLYSAQFGSNTSATPLLEVITQAGVQNLGVLSTERTASATVSIKVRTYLSGGYSMFISGNPPSQGTHTLTTTSAPETSRPGVEQFGVNLAKNTTPNIGVDPVQVPSDQISFGRPAVDYAYPDNFKYVPGQTVASSSSSTGETDYTLSMVINISDSTPDGHYHGSLSAVVVPVF